jgi:hypothetical protein
MHVHEFQSKWRNTIVSRVIERSAAQEHFSDACRMLGQPTPAEAELKARTLTNLYNQRPTWLANAHLRLDRAVWAAYGWPEDPADTDDDTILARLLALNLERAAGGGARP